jgi:hypothetical protein
MPKRALAKQQPKPSYSTNSAGFLFLPFTFTTDKGINTLITQGRHKEEIVFPVHLNYIFLVLRRQESKIQGMQTRFSQSHLFNYLPAGFTYIAYPHPLTPLPFHSHE